MAERMIIEPVERIEENYLETRNKVIENCWHMIVGNDTPKQEDGWLEVMNDRQTKNGIANIYNFIYKMVEMILDGCKDLDEAKAKVKELTEDQKKEKSAE